MTKDELIAYVRESYAVEPEYLWESAPDAFVFRHRNNRRWFAVILSVRRERLGLAGEGSVSVMDVKCGPLLSGSYIGKSGVRGAYHMNKSHWIGVLLDGSAEDETVRELLSISYNATEGGRAATRGSR